MTRNACIPDSPRSPGACRASPDLTPVSQNGPIAVDIEIEQLRRKIQQVGNPDNETVYGYVVRSVQPADGRYAQLGTGPNWQGGLITLCTCKHSMRASLTTDKWLTGKWIAGFTSWSSAFDNQQSLIYLMRVGEAYTSQAALVEQLLVTGRSEIVSAKDSSLQPLGDLMMPVRAGMPSNPHDPAAYKTPILGHAHRQSADHTDWHDDIHYVGVGGREAAMLAGDSRFSFLWTRAMVRRSRPGYTRPYRKWTLSDFLDDIEGVPR